MVGYYTKHGMRYDPENIGARGNAGNLMSLICNRVKTFRNRLFGCKAAVSRVWHSGGGGLAEFRKKNDAT